MSILDLFRGGSATPAANSQQAQPEPQQNQQPTPTPPAFDNNPDPTPAADVSPLDAFKDIWNPPSEGNKGGFDPANLFDLNPEKINAAVSGINFTDSLSPEVLSQINAGGEGAQQAFVQALNAVSQATFSKALTTNARLIQEALGKANNGLDSRISEVARRQGVDSNLSKTNPVLSHPAAKPLIASLTSSLADKYPNASAEEVSKLATQFLTEFAGSFSPASPSPTSSPANAGTDWDAWLNT